ncbi:MAG: hypothetical protein JWN77_2366 [Frankiales bacterium]|nr:hypothetical protein [Frankiales bacterium]
MDERQGDQGQQSRRALLRALPTPVDVELYVQDAPPLLEVMGDLPEPRIADLDALLREVDDLRCTLRRDFSLAATAADAGEDELAGWLLLGEDGEVRSFEERALAHLHELEARQEPLPAVEPRTKRRVRMLPAAPLVAACAALFGFLGGGLPGISDSSSTLPQTSNVSMDAYARVADLATSGASDHSISEAAAAFHAEIAPLVAVGASNPAAVEKAIALLRSERVVIASSGPDSPALRAVLRQADLLVARLQASLPRKAVRRPVVVVPVAPEQEGSARRSSPAAKATPAAKASPAASPSGSPSPKPSPKPSSSPAASPQPDSSDNPLPTSPLNK